MRPIIFFIGLFLSFTFVIAKSSGDISLSFAEQRGESIVATVTLKDYQIEEMLRGNSRFNEVSFSGAMYGTLKGAPRLPFKQFSFQVENSSALSLELLQSEFTDHKISKVITPARGTIYRNQNPSLIPYTLGEAYKEDKFYPEDITTLLEPFVFRDRRGVTVKVSPVQYNPVRGVIRVHTSLSLKINQTTTRNGQNPRKVISSSIAPEMAQTYKALFENYTRWDHEIPEEGDLHVVYTERDKDIVNSYINHKKQRGFTVTSAQLPRGTNVVNHVKKQYQENPKLLYIQLFGDWLDLKCGTIDDGRPSDPMIGCVAGNDLYPDLIIGRFSGNKETIIPQVEKTIFYENNPNLDFWENCMLIGSDDTKTGDDSELDWEHVKNIAEKKLLQKQYEKSFSIFKTGDQADVRDGIHKGAHIINYTGHGHSTGWLTTGFSNDDIRVLKNKNNYPIIISAACLNGTYHNNTTSFAEAWLQKKDGGAVAALMATISQPWMPPMRGQDYMNDLLTGGFDYDNYPKQDGISTTEGRTTFGSITFNGLVLMYAEKSETEDRETLQTWVLFGDASLKVVVDPVNNKVNNSPVKQKAITEITQRHNSLDVHISLTQRKNISLKVYTLAGKEIIYKNFGALTGVQKLSANLRGIAKGTYLMRLQSGNLVENVTFIRK